MKGVSSFVLYNVSGKIVVEQSFNNKHNKVDITRLPNGIYHYEITSANLEQVKGKISIVK
jgi:hypothetical protein